MNAMLITWFETLMLAVLAGLGSAFVPRLALAGAVSPTRAVHPRRRLITGADRLWLTSAGGSGPGRQAVPGGRASGCVLS